MCNVFVYFPSLGVAWTWQWGHSFRIKAVCIEGMSLCLFAVYMVYHSQRFDDFDGHTVTQTIPLPISQAQWEGTYYRDSGQSTVPCFDLNISLPESNMARWSPLKIFG